jgi:hypothetical protein
MADHIGWLISNGTLVDAASSSGPGSGGGSHPIFAPTVDDGSKGEYLLGTTLIIKAFCVSGLILRSMRFCIPLIHN